jgi:hypothetical protein
MGHVRKSDHVQIEVIGLPIHGDDMNQYLAKTSGALIPTLVAMTIGLFATAAASQNYLQGEPGEAPGVPQHGYGKPLSVDPAEVKRDNTADPGEAPFASRTGGRPLPVDPLELRRDNTANPGSLPSARR